MGMETMNGSELCYLVEARVKGLLSELGPVVTGLLDGGQQPFIIDNRWRRVPVASAAHGIPNKLFEQHPAMSGYQTYESAMAIAYWFIAGCSRSCVEVRLVRCRHEYTHRVTRLEEGPLVVHGFAADGEKWTAVESERQQAHT